MVIRADDELKHPAVDAADWQETLRYEFAMPNALLGGTLCYTYWPKAPKPFAKLSISLTRGWSGSSTGSLYLFDRVGPIPEEDLDDLAVGTVCRFKRLQPLKRWQVGFDDGDGCRLDLDVECYAGAWHWIDNHFETPRWLAADRYQVPFTAECQLKVDGQLFQGVVTGDFGHSWGTRRTSPTAKCKYIAGQCGSDWAMSFIEFVSEDGGKRPHGYLWDGLKFSSINNVEIVGHYDGEGVLRGALLNVVDEDARITRVVARGFAGASIKAEAVSSGDCYCEFEVNCGQHQGSGVLSFIRNEI